MIIITNHVMVEQLGYASANDPEDVWATENISLWTSGSYWGSLKNITKKLNDGLEIYKMWAEDDLDYKANELENLNDNLEYYTEKLEEWKEFQTTLASEEVWTEYAEMCAEKAELETAIYTLYGEQSELNINNNYYKNLMYTLFGFVGDETNEGSLPDYAELIEAAEKNIKKAKEYIADLEYKDYLGENKLNKEGAIAKKEAEIAAIETELEVRQAEYDAEMAELKALVGADEEEGEGAGEEEVPAE